MTQNRKFFQKIRRTDRVFASERMRIGTRLAGVVSCPLRAYLATQQPVSTADSAATAERPTRNTYKNSRLLDSSNDADQRPVVRTSPHNESCRLALKLNNIKRSADSDICYTVYTPRFPQAECKIAEKGLTRMSFDLAYTIIGVAILSVTGHITGHTGHRTWLHGVGLKGEMVPIAPESRRRR